MSATYINLDPIAQSIRSFGSGLANNALKKAQLDRQYAQDIVAFDKAKADIDYTNARNQREAEKHAAWARVADAMDLSQFTPLQQSLMGVNASAGSNVVGDAIRAANGIINPGGGGNAKGWMDRFSIRDIMPLYTNNATGEFDQVRFNNDYRRLRASKMDPTNGLFYDLATGVLKLPESQEILAQQNPQKPVATNLPTQPANQPKVGPIDIPSMQAVIEQMYRIGDISKEQAIEMAKMYGIKL